MLEDIHTKDHSTGDNRKETRQLMVTPNHTTKQYKSKTKMTKGDKNMKKYSILIALVLVVALAIPTSAAVTFSGSIGTTVKYEHKTKAFTPTLTVKFSPDNINAGGAVVAFSSEWKADLLWDKNEEGFGKIFTEKTFGYKTWMSITGPYTTGGPNVTTRIGYLGALGDLYNWVPGVVKSHENGISITGAKIAGAGLDLYYVQPVADKHYFAGVLKKGAFTNKFAYLKGDKEYRYRLDVKDYALTPELKARGYADYNTFGGGSAVETWEVGGNYKAAKDATFDGVYRYNDTYDVNGTFNLDAGQIKPTVVVGYKRTNATTEGVYASAFATLAEGIKAGAQYDDTNKTVNVVAGNMYNNIKDYVDKIADDGDKGQLVTGTGYGAVLKLVDGASTKELKAGITQDLTGLLNLSSGLKLYARAGAILDLSNSANNSTWGQLYGQTDVTTIPGFKKITVHGRVILEKGKDTTYGVGANYDAPNGINFKAGYNWKLGEAYTKKAYVNSDEFVIQASKTIKF